MTTPEDDLLLKRYREASALDEARPSPALREAVLAHARMAAASQAFSSSTSPGDRKDAFARSAAANEPRWAWRALGGLAVLGLAGLLVLQFERHSPEEHGMAAGSGAPAEVAEPATDAQAPLSPAPHATPSAPGSTDASAAAPARTARTPALTSSEPDLSAPSQMSEAPRPPAAPQVAERSGLRGRAASDAASAPATPSIAPGGDAGTSTLEHKEPIKPQAVQPELISAVKAGDNALVRRLLEQGIQVDSTDDQGQTALMLAARQGDAALIRMLLDAGADVRLKDANGLDAAAHARRAGQAGVLPLLPSEPNR